MDPFRARCLSFTPPDTTLQLGSKNYPSISNPADIQISSKAPKAPLFAIKPTSNSSTTQLISFGSSSSSSSTFRTNDAGKSGSNLIRLNTRFVASTEKRKDLVPAMISFKKNSNMQFSASASSSSSSSSSSLDLEELQHFPVTVKKVVRTPYQARYHVMLERKRREKLSQRFRALSQLLPGLKKYDKTSVIEGAIDRLKELEERVKQTTEELRLLKGEMDAESVHSTENSAIASRFHEVEDDGDEDVDDNNDHEEEEEDAEDDQPSMKKRKLQTSKGYVVVEFECKKETMELIREEDIASEIIKLDLTPARTKITPSGDAMVSVSIVAEVRGFSFPRVFKE
ncbi:OLC1v1007868C2 [Oldenlandia corymbosa var. corymbosa]|uniref:OLC1v1007868C2 n=1 Tax=Oldenlandia corymbosa var. corymbosa TaxID=529605 RepID=A0AAV1DNM1_OLDCO|nr:OLC1v1007868C2 [Oldenlandia corymbosa var. corymbosa]